MPKSACSESVERYFKALEEGAAKAYRVAERARAKGFDPSTQVEVPRADDLASRVEKLLRIEGLAERIRELSANSDRENVSILIAKETASKELERGGSKETALDRAVRVGLAVLTEGILVAPLDGIVAVRIVEDGDTSYASVSYSSPIASAGGTALAMSVLIADVVRRDLGVGSFRPTEEEVERFKEEVPLYRAEVALQYLPSGAEIEAAVRGCPVCIDGEGTERSEVSGHRDLPRIATNRLRGGACLVVANGLCHKSAKLRKHVEKLGIDGWEFLSDILRIQTASAEEDRTAPSEKYLKEQLAGRPVLSEASRPGGFRLRYGRTRSTGIAALGVHPATMALLGFVAVGTQLKIERPGKACAATPCDTIDGPWVLLEDGELLQLVSSSHAQALEKQVHEIVDLGDILVPFGEFAENSHPLMPAAWVEEWWSLELEKRGIPKKGDQAQESLVARSSRDSRAAVELARLGTPLHPRFTCLWHDLDAKRILALRDRVLSTGRIEGGKLILEDGDGAKRALVDLCVAHRGNQTLRIAEPWALLAQLGLEERAGRPAEVRRAPPNALSAGPMDLVRALSLLDVRERAPTRIGTRMGRPEKAKDRRMKPPVNLLFPLREGAVRQRDLEGVMEQASIRVEVQPRRCVEQGHLCYVPKCACGSWSEPSGPPQPLEVDIQTMLEQARARLGAGFVDAAAEKVKGVMALISRDKTPECLEKGLLRASRDVFVFKDGTIRFDATDVPLTHFTPREAGITVEKAKELGYEEDVEGRPLERDDQLLELMVQDILLPRAGAEHLVKVAGFVDDLLVKLYGLEPFYRAKEPADLIGQLVVGLAPHTSGGVLARMVGMVDAKVLYSHPYFHAAKRRNCLDGRTEVFAFNSPLANRTTLEAIFESTPSDPEVVDRFGTLVKQVKGLEVLSVDLNSGLSVKRRVASVLRTPAGLGMVKIRTKSGRSLSCSPEHRLVTSNSAGLQKVKAVGLTSGESLVFPRTAPCSGSPLDRIDLFGELLARRVGGISVSGLGDWLRSVIGRLGGLSIAARSAGISMKDLDNFRRRDSIPAEVLEKLLSKLGLTRMAIPHGITLAAKRDTVLLPRYLEVTPELMRLVGYFIAEGHARHSRGSAYQVSIAATEQEIVKDLVRCIRTAFLIQPRVDSSSVTVCSRLVYHVFVDVFGTGRNAHEKRIPARFASLPKRLTRELLSAYFSGDGSVEAGRLHVTCTSASSGLLRDVGFQLLIRGIGYRLRTETREAGGAVKQFYERHGRPSRSFTSHRISIRSSDATKFASKIGFTLPRKQRALEASLRKERGSRMPHAKGDLIEDEIESVEYIPQEGRFLYDLEVEGLHTYLVNDFLVSSNCDGDEDSVLLLMDCLLNFSRSFLPENRGGNMDAPLILATRIDPDEIDKEAHNLDVMKRYPLQLYEMASRKTPPKEAAKVMERVENRLGTPGQYEGLAFTHSSSSLTDGRVESVYATIESMKAKVDAQLELYRKLRAIDARKMVGQMLSYHFLRDMQGCLSRFARQEFRCQRCGEKYRRLPLSGWCSRWDCQGKIVLTVTRGFVVKYLQQARDLVRRYRLEGYVAQRLDLIAEHVDSTFGGTGPSRTIETWGE